ncbi:MAG: T9SS type A sorting domain-containing protein [Bacteroidetes bacterium]|nr:T9SS type A sorting domain-containing protein [Bacteroidota bacterium]
MKKTVLFSSLIACVSLLAAQTSPNITGTDIHGENVDMYAWLDDDKTVLLDFFFADCPPCNEMMPFIVDIHEEFGSDGLDLRVLGVSDRDNAARIMTFEGAYGADWANLPGSIGSDIIYDDFASVFSFVGFPTYSVVCPDRSITWDIWGTVNSQIADDIRTAILACGAKVATGIAEIPALGSLNLFPNPAADRAELTLTMQQQQTLSIGVYNLLGALALDLGTQEYATGTASLSINLSTLASGSYLVVLRNQEGITQHIDLRVAR